MLLLMSMYRVTVTGIILVMVLRPKQLEKFTEILWCIMWVLPLWIPKPFDLAF